MRILKFIAFAVVLTLSGSALADSEWKPHPSLAEEFKNSTMVIVGKVISARYVREPGELIKGTYYSLQVAEALKGSPPKIVELYSENSSGRFPMGVGVLYLIFASEGIFEGIKGQRLAIDASGNSGTLRTAKKALATARKLKSSYSPEPHHER
jgi:RNase P/RNase MRP subunit POP5